MRRRKEIVVDQPGFEFEADNRAIMRQSTESICLSERLCFTSEPLAKIREIPLREPSRSNFLSQSSDPGIHEQGKTSKVACHYLIRAKQTLSWIKILSPDDTNYSVTRRMVQVSLASSSFVAVQEPSSFRSL